MKFKILSKSKLVAINFSGVVFVLMLFLYFFPYSLNVVTYNQAEGSSSSSKTNNAVFSKQIKVNSSLPVRLKIPIIKVDSIVEYVGLTQDGAVDVPKGPNNSAWFDLSPRPGEIGSSIISGHSGWKNGIPAVFDNLYKLKIGDKIYIENDKKESITFVVRKIKRYNPKVDATDVFISKDGKSHLNLITCTGIWNIFSKSHSERLVVFADKE
ncbi:MAG TPA: class F sortase [Candidatus Paceibacterota bacterium]